MKHIVALKREFHLSSFVFPKQKVKKFLHILCCISRDFSLELDWSVLVIVMQVSHLNNIYF